MTSCPFCNPDNSRLILGNDHNLTIPDAFPLTPGHTLIVPKRHIVSLAPEAPLHKIQSPESKVTNPRSRTPRSTNFYLAFQGVAAIVRMRKMPFRWERMMTLTKQEKEALKRQVATCLASEPEVRKVVVFGSFLESDSPNDLDIAVFQESDESYLPLALKYRRRLAAVAEKIPLDVIPVRPQPAPGNFLREIERGEVVYER